MIYPVSIRPQAEKDIEKISRSPHLYSIVY